MVSHRSSHKRNLAIVNNLLKYYCVECNAEFDTAQELKAHDCANFMDSANIRDITQEEVNKAFNSHIAEGANK